MDYIEMGKRIRKKRLERNWKINELAEHADLSDDYVGKIERGTGIASLETIVKIANALNISVDYMIGKDLNTPITSYLNEDINDMLCHMEKDKRKRFLEFINYCSDFFNDWE